MINKFTHKDITIFYIFPDDIHNRVELNSVDDYIAYKEWYAYVSVTLNIVTYLYVPTVYRGKGIGTQLMVHLINWCRTRSSIRYITLDDCSDNFKNPSNIYVKLGFVYIPDNDNEMILVL
jgi:GNAT superfamily N-acetyltransferase